MELALVVAILAIVALLAVPRLAGTGEKARCVAAARDLRTLAEAFTDEATGYLRDLRGIPGFSVGYLRLANLLIPTNLYGHTSAAFTGFRVDETSGWTGRGVAAPATFTQWNAASGRGWRGPYVRCAAGPFPARADGRFPGDAPAETRGFYPNLASLRLPDDFRTGRAGCSVYGFPGESAPLDPWGNPYVLQIPPPQAFWTQYDAATNVSDETRFRYARIVSAGPDGRLETPCFQANPTNDASVTAWDERTCRASRQAGRVDGALARGDDLVHFLFRNDVDEGRRVE